jgi:hypothetical protein
MSINYHARSRNVTQRDISYCNTLHSCYPAPRPKIMSGEVLVLPPASPAMNRTKINNRVVLRDESQNTEVLYDGTSVHYELESSSSRLCGDPLKKN